MQRSRAETPSWSHAWWLVALAVPLFFVKLGAAGLVDPDEPYYALPALEMLRSKSWAVPLLHGQPWFDKPVLFYWIVLAAYKTFGVSEWAARIGSALAGLGGAVALAALAPSRWRDHGAHVLAAVVLGTSLEYALLSRAAVTDMTLTLFLTLGFLAFARHLETRWLRYAVAAGAAFGLAALTKGPVGLLVPAIALVAYALATRRLAIVSPATVACLAAGAAATAAPWYLYMLAAHRDLLMTVFLGEENLGRFLSPEHRQVPLFYVWVLAGGLLPWSAALPAALARAWTAWRRGSERDGRSPGPVYALTWFLAVLAPFSLSASKLATYVLPAFPAAAFLIADYWCEAFASRPGARGPRAAAWIGASLVLAVPLILLTLPEGGRYLPARPATGMLAVLLALGAVVSVLAVQRGRRAMFVASQAAATTAIVLFAVVLAGPRLDAAGSTRALVRRLEAEGLTDRLEGAYRIRDVSLDFYLGRPLPRESDPGRLRRRVDGAAGGLWVVAADGVAAVASDGTLVVEPVMTVARRAVVRLSPRDAARPAAP